MTEYHKIQAVFKRDMEHPQKKLIIGDWSRVEFGYLADLSWELTEKIDGTNIRVMWDGSGVTFGGRTDRAEIPADLLRILQDTFEQQHDTLRELFGDKAVVLYGEGFGGRIQAGQKYSPVPGFILFDVKVGHWWLRREDVTDIGDRLMIQVVPYYGQSSLWKAMEDAKGGIQSMLGNFEAEGYVARPLIELLDRSGQRIITKIKCRDFR
jgi:hypothetical protein